MGDAAVTLFDIAVDVRMRVRPFSLGESAGNPYRLISSVLRRTGMMAWKGAPRRNREAECCQRGGKCDLHRDSPILIATQEYSRQPACPSRKRSDRNCNFLGSETVQECV